MSTPRSFLDIARSEKLHSGMFRLRTIQEVERIRDMITGKETNPRCVPLVLEGLADLGELCVDREILGRTSIGKLTSKLSKHADVTVSRKATDLVQSWKHDHERRQKVVDAFVEKGRGVINKRNAMDMEDGLFEEACPLGILEGEGWKEYQRHFKRLCTHLRNDGPGSLIHQLQERSLKYNDVAKKPDTQLISEAQCQKKLDEKKEGLRNAIGCVGNDDGFLSDQYQCGKCKSSRCSYKDVQSGWHNDQQDSTIIVRCLECRHFWKESDDHGLAG